MAGGRSRSGSIQAQLGFRLERQQGRVAEQRHRREGHARTRRGLRRGSGGVPPIPADQRVGGRVVAEPRVGLGLQFRHDPHGEHLAQFHAPLVERIDAPDAALREHAVLVERHQAAQHAGREPLGENGRAGTVAGKRLVRHERLRHTLRPDLVRRLAEGQRLGLREHVRHEQIVVPSQRIRRTGEAEEIAGDQPRALVDQLVEGVLPVPSGSAAA